MDLNNDNLPTRIEWQAAEALTDEPPPCRSMMLSLWDSKSHTTAAIDPSTKDATVDDMNLYVYQVFHKIADTSLRETKINDIGKKIHKFGDGFGQTLGLR